MLFHVFGCLVVDVRVLGFWGWDLAISYWPLAFGFGVKKLYMLIFDYFSCSFNTIRGIVKHINPDW